jgi:hypothetical protein
MHYGMPRSNWCRRRLVSVALVLLAAAVATSSQAQKLYWSTGYLDHGIHRADPDGSNVELVVPGADGWPAIDPVARKIYWLDLGVGGWELVRANLDGSQRQVLHEVLVPVPEALAVDGVGGWAYLSASVPTNPEGGCFEIRRYRTSGGGSHETVVPDVCAFGVAVDSGAGKLYWAEHLPHRAIRRANLDGSGIETVIELADAPLDLKIDAARGKLYWSSMGIFRADTDGSNLELVRPGNDHPDQIALDLWSDKIYWTVFSVPRIMRADLDGSNPEVALETDPAIRLRLDFDAVPNGADVPAVSWQGTIVLVFVLLAVSAVVVRRRGAARGGPRG